jgi:hypothetical protein
LLEGRRIALKILLKEMPERIERPMPPSWPRTQNLLEHIVSQYMAHLMMPTHRSISRYAKGGLGSASQPSLAGLLGQFAGFSVMRCSHAAGALSRTALDSITESSFFGSVIL